MRGTSHALVGIAASSAVAVAAGHGLAVPLLALGALAGMLPDIDHPHSDLGRFVPWPSVEVQGKGTFVRTGRKWFGGHTIWHRGETHSLGAAVVATGLAAASGIWLAAPGLAQLGWLQPGWAWAGQHPLWLGGVLALVVALGYTSHLFADLINPSPQMWGWPVSSKMRRPRHLPAVKSGTLSGWLVEMGIVALLMAGVWAEIGRNLL
jgi:inner membrane protein